MANVAIQLAIGLGAMLIQRLLTPKPKDIYGPRVADINVPAISPGNPIPRFWGTMKLPAQIIWASRLKETRHEDGGGKGTPQPKQITYTYAVDAAWGICLGPIKRVNRIWSDQKLLWINPELAGQEQAAFDAAYYAELDRLYNQAGLTDADAAYVGAFFFAYNNYRLDNVTLSTQAEALAYIVAHPGSAGGVANIPAPNSSDVNSLLGQMLSQLNADYTYQSYKKRYDSIDIYLGDEYQLPNPTIEAAVGAGLSPAYRGVAYFVLNNLQLEDYGNTVPTMLAEVTKTDGSTSLYAIIQDICLNAGLDSTQFDSSGLPAVTVGGFCVTQNSSSRDALVALQKVFPFDGAESSFRLIFNWINSRPSMLVRREDFGARIDSDQLPPTEELTRAFDFDLPRRINLKFQEPVRNYSLNSVFAERQITESNLVEDTESTVAITRAEAKTWVEEQLAVRFNSRRTTKIMLPRKYVIIEPGDVIFVPDKDDPTDDRRWYQLRCLQVSIGVNGLLETTFMDHSLHEVSPAITESDLDVTEPDGPPESSPTYGYLFDSPLLSDVEEDNIGFYGIVTGSRSGWPGGAVYVDEGSATSVTLFGETTIVASAGTNWGLILSGNTNILHGLTMSQLSQNARPMMWDHIPINIYLYDQDALMASASEMDVMVMGLNFAMIGNEIIAFATATQLGSNIWQLSGILRGLRGTEGEINNHSSAGERFFVLPSTLVQRLPHDVTLLDVEGTYKAVTSGDTLDSATAFTFTNTGNSLRPRAPIFHHKFRHPTTHDVDITWIPRVRQNGNFLGGLTVTLDQPSESYEMDVFQSSVLKKTYTFGAVRTFSYPAATQTSDGLNPATAMTLKLYEIGATIGRGYVSSLTL